MKEKFSNKNIGAEKLLLISNANTIIRQYMAKGYTLTLRQLYYQFIARGVKDSAGVPMPNTVQSYKKLGDAVSDGRMLGMLDWDAIEDRTRGVERNLRLTGPKNAIEIVRAQYGIDMWENQPRRVEVWIEKEALIGVIEPACKDLDIPFLACRGYVSQSEQWRAYRRFHATRNAGQGTVILHFGDHDPSGMDMTRDNRERLEWFLRCTHYREHNAHADDDGIEVRRLALNMDQVEQYEPPPNPAKQTDSRFAQYAEAYGDESWELDALDPEVITKLITDEVDEIRDPDLWAEKEQQLEEEQATLDAIIEGLPK